MAVSGTTVATDPDGHTAHLHKLYGFQIASFVAILLRQYWIIDLETLS